MIINSEYVIRKTETNDIEIVDEGFLKVVGILNGNIEVKDNGNLQINGIVNGDIYINNSSNAVISGMVNGKIINKSKLKVGGVIKREIIDIDNGVSVIEEGSIVNGIKY